MRAGTVVAVIGFTFAAAVLVVGRPTTPSPAQRPKILGIAGVRLTVTDVKAAKNFYGRILEPDRPCVWCGDMASPLQPVFYAYNDQHVLLDYIAFAKSQKISLPTLLEEIIFFTDNIAAMREYLTSQGIVVSENNQPGVVNPKVKEPLGPEPEHVGLGLGLRTVDPEGHVIGFVQQPSPLHKRGGDEPIMKIIHAGFIVHDPAAENRFYQDTLGFRLYWKGGMKDTETDWMDMQVPDGTDWIEYMLNVPETADARTRGVMNHFAVGVPDIEQAAHRLERNGIKLTEQPKIGRDGKWQLNLYDPDQTRVELMEFTPVEKACCVEYTGPHPKVQ